MVLVAMCMSECWDAREKRDERAEALRESLVRGGARKDRPGT